MLERVARAICAARGLNPDCLHWNDGSNEYPNDALMSDGKSGHFGWRHHAKQARAVIEAMREPTEKMVAVADKLDGGIAEHRNVWKAMIDEAIVSGK